MPEMAEQPSNRHVFTLYQWVPLADVVDAIAFYVAARHRPSDIWIGRRGNRWRWSFTTRGGPYPMLRETAQYLGESHNEIAVHCAVTEDGVNDVGSRVPAGDHVVLSIAPGSTPATIETAVRDAFTDRR